MLTLKIIIFSFWDLNNDDKLQEINVEIIFVINTLKVSHLKV